MTFSRVTPLFKKHCVSFAYLFGSQANNTNNLQSDVDLAVYFEEQDKVKRFESKLFLMSKISGILNQKTDLVVLNDIRNNYLLRDIIFEGKVIFDQNPHQRFVFETSAQHQVIDYFNHLKYANLV